MSEVERVSVGDLKVAKILHDFIIAEVIPGTGIEASSFWQGLEPILHLFAPLNRALLQRRDALQAKIDDWYRGRRGRPFDEAAHKAFLQKIGYLVPEGPPFGVDTANVDNEIAKVAGPQLVVPISNARYALNAANARWGSLYDALYGSSLFGTLRSSVFRPLRCSAVNIFRGSALLFGISSVAPPAWDQKNEMAQSDARPDRAVARSIQEPKRTHLIHRPAKDIFPPRGRTHIREKFSSPC